MSLAFQHQFHLFYQSPKTRIESTMKFSLFSASALMASAVDADMGRLAKALQARVENQTFARQFLRSGAEQAKLDGSYLGRYFEGYGCWCNFDENKELSAAGKGKPVDTMDELCKNLRDNYECIMMDEDAIIDDEPCKPWTQSYGSVVITSDVEKLQSECELVAGKNGELAEIHNLDFLYGNYNGNNRQTKYNKCVELSCIVETYFLSELDIWLQSTDSNDKTQYDYANAHSSATFDKNTVCRAEGGTADSERECCGNYPNRSPFKPMNNARECCADQVVRLAGTC